jgi:hypothetical protein
VNSIQGWSSKLSAIGSSIFIIVNVLSWKKDQELAVTWCLLALMFTMKTKVLLSSIFFIADSVVRGCLMMLWASILLRLGIDFLGYLGFLAGRKVLGRWKCTDVRTFLILVPWVPLTIFFCIRWALWAALCGTLVLVFSTGAAAGFFSTVFLGTGFLALGALAAGAAAFAGLAAAGALAGAFASAGLAKNERIVETFVTKHQLH